MTARRFVVAGASSLTGAVLASPTLAVGPWLCLFALTRWERSASTDATHRQLLADLPPYLDALAHRLGAGGSLTQVLRDTPAAPALEARLRLLRAGLSHGLGLDASLRMLRSGLATDPDRPVALDRVVDVLEVLVGRGGPALPSLERLNDTIRSAEWIDAEVRLQAGQATASAVVLAGLPLLFAGGLAALDPRLAHLYLYEPVGAACLFVAAGLSYGGWRWIARIVRPRRYGPPKPGATMPQRFVSPAALVGTAILAVVVAALVSVVVGVGVAVVAVGAARLSAKRNVTAERQALTDALPEAIDLCTVVLGAGGTIPDCVDALAKTGPHRVRPSAAEALARAGRGHRFDQALRWLQADLGPSFQPLTGTLLVAREQGGAIGELLARLSVEASASRRRAGELRARQLPVALLIPLVTCSLPAVIVGAVLPLAIVAIAAVDL